MSDYATLLARLEAATEGSRELDFAVCQFLGEVPPHAQFAECAYDYDYGFCWSDGDGYTEIRQVTSSFDAALTLLDGLRMKPHWTISYPAAVVELIFGDGEVIDADHATPALAVCLAFVRASQSLEERK